MSIKTDEIIEKLKDITLLEASELIKKIVRFNMTKLKIFIVYNTSKRQNITKI